MEHCLSSSHHKVLTLPSPPISTFKPRSNCCAPPKHRRVALTRRLTVVAGAGASSHCDFSSLNSPLDPRTRSGKDLSSVLQNHPQLFHLAVAEELKRLADEREEALTRMSLSASSHEACLHRALFTALTMPNLQFSPVRIGGDVAGCSCLVTLFTALNRLKYINWRIAQLKEQHCRSVVEDVMYLLIFYKFSEVKVPLVPKLSRFIYHDRLEILPARDWELESIYSLEVLEMVREHVTTVIGLRANSSVSDNWAMRKISRHMLGRVYVASILYGYFLKSVSLRHHLERSLFLESQDLHLSCRTSLQEMSHGIKSLLFGHIGENQCIGSSRQGKTHDKLKCYVRGFNPETLQKCAKLRSEEAVNLIKNHCCALFGDDAEMGSLGTDEVISTSFSSLKRLVLEAVAFGSFLWDTEECIGSVYKLKDN